MPRRIRIGIDTGGTFTDVVAFDEDTGELVTTKTPSTPDNPADGFLAGIDKVLGLLGATGADIDAVSHGTTVATNQLLEGKVDRLGFVTNTGYEAMLEIARQSVPDGYGNSYFWVKPDRIVPRDLVKGVEGRLDVNGAEVRPFDEDGAREVARWFRAQGVDTLGVCFLHAYANPDHEERMRAVLLEEHPDAVVSLSSEVLREYREYERAMTTLVDAAVKPRLSAYVANIKWRLGPRRPDHPVLRDEVQRRRAVRRRGGAPTDHDRAVRPGRRRARRRADRQGGRVRPGADLRRRRYVDRRVGRDRRRADAHHRGLGGRVPLQDPDDRRGHGRCRRRLDRVALAGGTLKVGPQSAGADPGPLCYAKGGSEVTITDAHVVLGRIPPHLLGGEIPLDVSAAREGVEALASKLGLSPEACATGVLEISAWNQANALRQVTVKRGLDVRDFTLTTFGGSGSLLLCRLMDVLGIPTVLVPPNPGNVSAFGLLTVDVKNDYVQTHVALADALDPATVAAAYDDLTARAADALAKEGFAPEQHQFVRTADLRYFGQAFEVRVAVPDQAVDQAVLDEVVTRFHAEHRGLYGYDFSGDATQQVEWVNLRVSGIGPIQRPEIKRHERTGWRMGWTDEGPPMRPVCFDAAEGYVDTPLHQRRDLSPGQGIEGPAVIEEFGSTVPIHPGFKVEVDEFLNLIVTRSES